MNVLFAALSLAGWKTNAA